MDWLTASCISLLPPCIMIEDHIASMVGIKIQHFKSGSTECRLLVYHQKVRKAPVEDHLLDSLQRHCRVLRVELGCYGLPEEVSADLCLLECGAFSPVPPSSSWSFLHPVFPVVRLFPIRLWGGGKQMISPEGVSPGHLLSPELSHLFSFQHTRTAKRERDITGEAKSSGPVERLPT